MKSAKIIVHKNCLVEPHEIRVARILSKTDSVVEFLEPKTIPTPDILFDGNSWEIKSPRGNSRRTIENNIRSALRQSKNIIIDLSRMGTTEEKGIREVIKQDKLIKTKHRIIIITKDERIIKLF